MGGQKQKEALQCYLMIGTMIIGFLLFTLYPIIWTFKWGWFAYNGVASETKFVGWQNFITLFTKDATYWRTWITTIQFAAAKVIIEIPFALLLAIMLSSKIKGSGVLRSIYYLPNIISAVVIGLIISNMFSYWGLINTFLMRTGIMKEPLDWFATKKTAMAMLVFGSVWNGFGVNVMYFMAALTNVSEDVYESAKIDGASPVRTFFSITLPMIVPVFKIILLMCIIASLGVNEYILVTTNGGPSGQTATVMSYLTKQFVPGFAETSTPNLGYGCAMSMITTIIFALISLCYSFLSKRMKSY